MSGEAVMQFREHSYAEHITTYDSIHSPVFFRRGLFVPPTPNYWCVESAFSMDTGARSLLFSMDNT